MRIGIEPNLSNIKNYLVSKGCECTTLDASNGDNLNIFDAIVVTGQDDDIMGYEDTGTDIVIIEAAGMTPEEVYEEIQYIEY